MGQSFYVYNNGDLRRKDNTLQFTNAEGEKKDIPIERIDDISCDGGDDIQLDFSQLPVTVWDHDAFL